MREQLTRTLRLQPRPAVLTIGADPSWPRCPDCSLNADRGPALALSFGSPRLARDRKGGGVAAQTLFVFTPGRRAPRWCSLALSLSFQDLGEHQLSPHLPQGRCSVTHLLT